MFPDGVVAVLVFVVAAAPGYFFVRLEESRALRPFRSALMQAAELVVVGVGSTIGSLILTFAVWRLLVGENPVDLELWAEEGHVYLEERVYRVVTLVLLTIAGSNLLAVGSALSVHKGRPPQYQPGHTVWVDVLGKDASKTNVFLSMRLKDGRLLEGFLYSFQTDASPEGILIALQTPIFVTLSKGSRQRLQHTDRVVVRTQDVIDIGIRYEPVGRDG